MPRLFISRDLPADSPLRSWAIEQGYSLIAQSLLSFEAVTFTVPSYTFDWLFFYSPRAVAFFCDQQNPASVATSIAAIGGGTAKELMKRGFAVDFCGKGSPERVARDFISVALECSVLFPLARQSRRSVAMYLGDQINATELIVYTNEMLPPETEISANLVILTSPLNVRSWFLVHSLKPEQQFLAIGPSTAAALAERGVEASYPPAADEESLVNYLRENHAIG